MPIDVLQPPELQIVVLRGEKSVAKQTEARKRESQAVGSAVRKGKFT